MELINFKSNLIISFLYLLLISNVQAILEGWWGVGHSWKEDSLKIYQAELSVSPREPLCGKGENVTLTYTVNGDVTECVTLYLMSSPKNITIAYPGNIQLCPNSKTNSTEVLLHAYQEGIVILTVEADKQNIIYTGDAYVNLSVRLKASIDTFGDIIGWIYTIAWDFSFLPQIYHNWRRKCVIGLSFDFLTLNLIGFSCYSLFNIGLYWIPAIQDQYYIKHPTSVLHVRLNDVIFPLYAVLCTIIQISQCFIYERGDQRVSTTCRTIAFFYFVVTVIYLILASIMENILWIDFLYFLSYIKLSITCIKYLPQLYENYKRKSTEGWSIYQVILDFTGGSLSLVQMFMLGYNYDDIKSVLTDPTKLGLGLLSVFFNIFFLLQHYVVYRNKSIKLTENEKPKFANSEHIEDHEKDT